MDGKGSTEFGSAINGFNRKEVAAYIARMNSEFASAEEEYKRKIKEREASIEELKTATLNMREKVKAVDKLLSELDEAKATTQQLTEKLTALSAENERLTMEIQLLTAKCERLSLISESTDATQELCDECSSESEDEDDGDDEEGFADEGVFLLKEDYDLMCEKAALYDGVCAKTGDILIRAHEDADKLTEDAKAKAEELKARATFGYEAVLTALIHDTETALSAVRDKINETASESSILINGCFSDINGKIEAIIKSE